MSGNKERLTMATSSEGFAACCSHCGQAREFRFKSPGYYYSVRVRWEGHHGRPDVRRRDWRTTTKSFQRHKLYCGQCRNEIVDKRIKQQAIDIVLAEAAKTNYW